MHLCKYQINPCPAEPRYIPFLETTDQLSGSTVLHSVYGLAKI